MKRYVYGVSFLTVIVYVYGAAVAVVVDRPNEQCTCVSGWRGEWVIGVRPRKVRRIRVCNWSRLSVSDDGTRFSF